MDRHEEVIDLSPVPDFAAVIVAAGAALWILLAWFLKK